MILCPACNKPYEYCHGEFKSPYFRHKEKGQCEDFYSEPETEEHINGKKDLFEWIKTQDGVTDAILEGWIPETHQRPDIMFKYEGSQCVIEYQCTPIASEYLKRHDLYHATGIVDIWILGMDNYNGTRGKVIEEFAFGYYNVKNKVLSLSNIKLKINEFNKLSLNYIIKKVGEHEENLELRRRERTLKKIKIQYVINNYYIVVKNLNNFFQRVCKFELVHKKSNYYILKIYCDFRNEHINNLTIFINYNSFDVCFYDFNSCSYQNIYTVKYDNFNLDAFQKMIVLFINRHIDNAITKIRGC